ncbi:OmpH family outer membrane protein [secondary endosymbiont of Trabutina mannipara]|uniref:OmpH family outer membrane protein n=1 Tax=secondary endosymbiont of Trabutina mannipara TaxID=1835721 RepID=UPI0009F5F732|nr:OmpH family outer membrane protein [secondary endosymbiont of Trabutina mannipara]
MRIWLYAAVLAITIPNNAYAADKIAVVNISSIFQQSLHLNMIDKKLENEFKRRATELQFMELDLQTKIKILRQNISHIKTSEFSTLEKSVVAQRENLSKKAQEFEQDNRRRQTEERNKIMSNIQDAVKNVAIKEGYSVVIDASAVAYIKNAKDITANVIKNVR